MAVNGRKGGTIDELARDMPEMQFVKNYHPQLYEPFDSRVRTLVL